METITNKSDALNVLFQAVEMAQQKGIYTLKDAYIIFNAVEFLSKTETEVVENIIPE